MKTEFLYRLGDIIKEAKQFLNSLQEGKTIVLATEEEIAANYDVLMDLPFASRVGKFGEYDEFGVIAVEKRNGQIVYKLAGRGEISGERVERVETDLSDGFYSISDESLCELIDRISEQI